MCGFAGAWERDGKHDGDNLTARIRAMTDSIVHRGPDDEGVWTDLIMGLGLGFRRLAILELSPLGHQPMASAEGRFVLVFNGEIYNHNELRTQLRALGHGFRGLSDTEVILAAFEQWGVEAAVPRFWGMFAFSLWDRREHRLWLGRDRLGKKPLYYGWQGGSFLFGSELRALRCHPDFQGGVDPAALRLFLLHACVPSPLSIHPGVSQLAPGSLLSLGEAETAPHCQRYWDPALQMPTCAAQGFRGNEAEAEEALLVLLRSAVAMRSKADVPVGAFLSGGIDSSLVTALLQEKGAGKVQTFTIGFGEAGYDEAGHAAKVARHLGTEHAAVNLSSREILDGVPLLATIYDEPFADISQLPTYLLCAWARKEVIVALSGDGGDEGFLGYWRAFAAARIWGRLQRVPLAFRAPAAAMMRAFPPAIWDSATSAMGLGSFTARYRLSGARLAKAAAVLGAPDLEGIHQGLLAHGDPDHWLVEPASGGEDPWSVPMDMADPAFWMACKDARTYLPDDVLVKVDRASMAVSLEMRAPLLDHRVMEFAWSLPADFMAGHGQGKRILRNILKRYLPDSLVDGPKHGFEVPLGDWLRGPLRDWAEALLNSTRLIESGFKARPVLAQWQIHLAGRRDRSEALWPVLVYLQWREAWG